MLRSARERTFAAGEIVVSQGNPALHLYLVVRGHADVEQEGQGRVGRLGPGDFFGELALIEEHARTATVVRPSSADASGAACRLCHHPGSCAAPAFDATTA